MIITLNMPARDPDATARALRRVASEIQRGMTSGLIQSTNGDRGFWESEGLAE